MSLSVAPVIQPSSAKSAKTAKLLWFCSLWAAGVSPWEARAQDRLQSIDMLRLRSVAAVQLSPDATRVAYTVENNDGPGRPYTQLWVMTFAAAKSVRFGGEKDGPGGPGGRP